MRNTWEESTDVFNPLHVGGSVELQFRADANEKFI